jgi:inorganic pyrophosphatase
MFTDKNDEALYDLLAHMFQAHPWHGVSPGERAPNLINAYIEVVPTDGVKYELNKITGYLSVDRPQRFSSLCPTPYGFVPQTFCGERVAELSQQRENENQIRGDGDPLDICVLTEKAVTHGDFIVRAKPIGGLRMIDNKEADDKIIAVLLDDVAYGHMENISDCPSGLIDRLRHYFLSYKQLPNETTRRVEIAAVYDRAEAADVITRSMLDYRERYGAPEERMGKLRRLLGGANTSEQVKR